MQLKTSVTVRPNTSVTVACGAIDGLLVTAGEHGSPSGRHHAEFGMGRVHAAQEQVREVDLVAAFIDLEDSDTFA